MFEAMQEDLTDEAKLELLESLTESIEEFQIEKTNAELYHAAYASMQNNTLKLQMAETIDKVKKKLKKALQLKDQIVKKQIQPAIDADTQISPSPIYNFISEQESRSRQTVKHQVKNFTYSPHTKDIGEINAELQF